uniref:Uncharacterized protein n=1 Tax=Rhizophora mucronata TaxID=61149 RepID=A0A2P2QQ23_RHIMU
MRSMLSMLFPGVPETKVGFFS